MITKSKDNNKINHQGNYLNNSVDDSVSKYCFDDIIGHSKLLQKEKKFARKAAEYDSSVLILGESGTGKELFAHAIHHESARRDRPFARVNCSAIPDGLIESELFGYEGGAFTGANSSGKIGKFEFANHGTIFLDEIGEMPYNIQAKLLRVLEEKEIVKIGGNVPRRINFRLISATNQNIKKMMEQQSFRVDLFYRINVFTIDLPPLREIKEDIALLVQHFLNSQNRINGKRIDKISNEALEILKHYDWPGNIRELRNVIERSYLTCTNSHIDVEDLPLSITKPDKHSTLLHEEFTSLKELIARTEKQAIMEALKISGNQKAAAAALLGIHRTGLYHKLKKYRLT
jgi:transcriptional regulator with PAS, ATPase and Fis domain